MADRTLTVGNGKTYATLNAALTAQRSYLNLTSDNGSGGPGKVYIDCYNLAAGAADTTAADTGTGWTTDANNYLVIRGAPSERTSSNTGVYSTTRYHLELTNAVPLRIQASYTRLLDLQVQLTMSSWTTADISTYSLWNAQNLRVERCIAKAVLSGTNTKRAHGFYLPEAAGVTVNVINCLAFDYINGSEVHNAFVVDTTNGQTVNILNCTAVNCYYGFEDWKTVGAVVLKNCGASGCTTAFVNCPSQTTCSSSTPTFVDAGADNFHLASGDTTWKGQGTSLAGTVDYDVDWQNRSGTWDIGFDQYTSASTRTVTIGANKLYPTLSEAFTVENAAFPNLTSNNGSGGAGILTFECYNLDGGVADTAAVATGTWTTSTSYYLKIVGAPSELTAANRGKYSTSRYRLEVTDSIALAVTADYTRCYDLQVKVITSSSTVGRSAYRFGAGVSQAWVERCIAVASIGSGSTSSSVGFNIGSDSTIGTHRFINCLAYDFTGYLYNDGFGCNLSSTIVYWFNCTAYGNYYNYRLSAGTAYATNCGSAAHTGGNHFQGSITQTYCSSTTPTFVNEAGDDFHLKSADTAWKDAGDGNGSGSGNNIPKNYFTDDVDQQSRPVTDGDWDIGFDEVVAVEDRTVTVGPSKTYSTLSSAISTEVAAYPDLTTNNGSGGAGKLIFECYNMEEGTTAEIDVAGFTVDSSYYVVIRGAASDKTLSNTGKWSTERYRIKAAVNQGTALRISCQYTLVQDLQIWTQMTSSAGANAGIYFSAGSATIERCIFRATISGSNSAWYAGVSAATNLGTVYIRNCIAYDFILGGETLGRGFYLGWSGTTFVVDNCTAVNCYYGFQRGSGTFNCRNCGASGCTTGFSTLSSNTNFSDATPTFVDAGNDDFHLAAADSTWQGQGSSSGITFTDDIDGQTRVDPWDIGADEYIASAARNPVPMGFVVE